MKVPLKKKQVKTNVSYDIVNEPSKVERPKGKMLILGTSNWARHLTKFGTPGYWINEFEELLSPVLKRYGFRCEYGLSMF